jgi:NAD(P)-dependent dehydrogenase (short-subunit alcohol dehydrogenase family)
MALKFINKLAGKRVLVLGGTSGLGFAVAQGAIEQGATVIISSSSSSKIALAVERLRAGYPDAAVRIAGYVCDLSNTDTVQANLEDLLGKATDNGAHKLNHLAYTAGAPNGVGVTDISAEIIAKVQALSVVAPMTIAKLIPKFMHISSESSFTVTTGIIGYKPAPGWTLVALAGGALSGAILGLAGDLKPLRVNAVSPGTTETELIAPLPTEVKEGFKAKTLLGKLGQPEDVAEAYLYLMKDSFVTGTTIHSNGGALLA